MMHVHDVVCRCAKKAVEHDAPISRFYERLTSVQARSSQVSVDWLMKAINCAISYNTAICCLIVCCIYKNKKVKRPHIQRYEV